MIPQIRTKYRKKFGIKYAVEYLRGRQYRCLHCNETFYTENELLRHIQRSRTDDLDNKKIKPPKLGDSVKAMLLYTEDIKDELRQKLIKSKYKE
jgi:hypothetical protein